MVYEILEAPKSEAPTEELLRQALAKEKPGFSVENIESNATTWTIRLAEVPDFLKKKDDADSSDDADAPDDSADDSADDADSDDDGDSDKGKSDKSKGSKNPAAEVKRVIDQLTGLFTELGGHVEELQAAHDEKDQKLKDISDTANDGATDGAGDEGDVGPTPGSPPAAPKPPMPGPGLDRRKPGVPGPPGGGLPAFTNYQVATHPGVNEKGERISLTAAASALEADPDFSEYEVVGMTENQDGTFSAKLKRKDV